MCARSIICSMAWRLTRTISRPHCHTPWPQKNAIDAIRDTGPHVDGDAVRLRQADLRSHVPSRARFARELIDICGLLAFLEGDSLVSCLRNVGACAGHDVCRSPRGRSVRGRGRVGYAAAPRRCGP